MEKKCELKEIVMDVQQYDCADCNDRLYNSKPSNGEDVLKFLLRPEYECVPILIPAYDTYFIRYYNTLYATWKLTIGYQNGYTHDELVTLFEHNLRKIFGDVEFIVIDDAHPRGLITDTDVKFITVKLQFPYFKYEHKKYQDYIKE